MEQLYPHARLLGSANLDGQDTYVVQLTAPEEKPVRLYVSKESYLIVERETEGQPMILSDYREVDGQQVPFITTIHDALGETSIRIMQIEFNRNAPDTVVAPATATLRR